MELRAHDLAFSEMETAELLRLRFAVELDDGSVELLHRRTEGWPAAVHLAGVSLQDTTDATAFVAEADQYRTLADISDEPPQPLVLDMLEPTGQNLMYAAPGVGKGTTGAWMCRELQALGMRPVVYDAEQREREWARRVSGRWYWWAGVW